MKVFITGASGFIGSQVSKQLIGAGHQVLGLARSEESAKAIKDAGAEAHRGSLDDLDSLRSGAAAAVGEHRDRESQPRQPTHTRLRWNGRAVTGIRIR